MRDRSASGNTAFVLIENGAIITLLSSWDVWASNHPTMELYGTKGSLFLPDPNFFGGKLEAAGSDGEITEVTPHLHPFGMINDLKGNQANYRTAGLADMAVAILEVRDHRCSLEFATHVVEVMLAALSSGDSGAFVEMTTTCERPAALGPDEAKALMI